MLTDADAGGIAIALLHLSAGALTKLQSKKNKGRLKFQDFKAMQKNFSGSQRIDLKNILGR